MTATNMYSNFGSKWYSPPYVHLTMQHITAVFQVIPTYFSSLVPSISYFGDFTLANCNLGLFI